MAVVRTSKQSVASKQGKPINFSTEDDTIIPWVRPSDWLTMPEVLSSENKFVGLLAIFSFNNAVALSATVTGGFTVDWGDGSSPENFASAATAQHQYTYSSISGSTLSTRGYKQVIVQVYPTVAGTGISRVNLQLRPSTYYTVNAVSETGWLDVTFSSTLASTAAIYTGGAPTGGSTMWTRMLERIRIINSYLTDFYNLFGGCSALQSLEIVNRNTGSISSMGSAFSDCNLLQEIPAITNVVSSGNFNASFSGCRSLKKVPNCNYSSMTNGSLLFSNCSSLVEVPRIDTSNTTNFGSMFSECVSLQSVGEINTSNGTTFSSMFTGCRSLKKIHKMDLSKGILLNSMFSNCSSLSEIPEFVTSACTDINAMFQSCTKLKTIPLLDTSNVTNFSTMFNNASSLEYVPYLNINKATTLASMFSNCPSLTSANLNGSTSTALTTIISAFTSCTALQTIGTINLSGLTSAPGTSWTTATGSLSSLALVNLKHSISIASGRLSATELNAIYTSLGTLPSASVTAASGSGSTVTYTTAADHGFKAGQIVTVTGLSIATGSSLNLSAVTIAATPTTTTFTVTNATVGTSSGTGIAQINATITVTSNPGTTTDDPTIATAKGWTVTG